MNKEILADKCRGSLVGGAVGDALGYAVEFMSLPMIRKRYGEQGIRNYDLDPAGVAPFSDDTQMSLYTAMGLLQARADGKTYLKEIVPFIEAAYHTWYYTQAGRPYIMRTQGWIPRLGALWMQRAPGNTCMSALGTTGPVINNSKGCGGVMRVAPIGIYSGAHSNVLNMVDAAMLAGMAADLTHKHPLSTLSSMVLTMLVADCITHESIDREKFRFMIIDRVIRLMEMHGQTGEYFDFLKALMIKALDLAESDDSDTDAIKELGEGWVAEETLAIALFAVMRHIDDFDKCIRCAVNHDGDSDSTGAVAGNIIGAILGYNAIPRNYLVNLELHDVLVSVGDDLAGISSEEQMKERYVKMEPYGVDPKLLLDPEI